MVYDIIIIGGGLVGAGLAAALRPSGLRVALIDARMPSADDPRLFALNICSCKFLENIGVWSKLSPHAAPMHQVHVSYQGYFGAVRLRCEDAQLPALGHVIPAHIIESVLNNELNRDDFFTIYRPAKLIKLHQQNGRAQITLETADGEKVLETAIVIGADGTESTVRKQLNIHAEIFDYQQSALVTRSVLQRSHKHVAYERFNKKGAIAMLPLTGNECATIWTADTETITQLMTLSDTEFLHQLQKEFGYRLGRLLEIRKRYVFPLRMLRAEKAVDQCVFLLGNSAHTLHPIASQGLNLALYEIAALVQGITQKISRNEKFSAEELHEISHQTQKQQAKSIGLSHRLSHLFSSDSALLNIALQAGMTGFDIATPVKKRFIEEIIGKTGRIPDLLLDVTL